MAIKLSGSTIIDDSRNIVNAGIVTATSFDGDGSGLSGIVTSITAGTGITISGSTGNVTINASGGGSGGIGLTDFSVTTATASGGGSLSYNNTTGEFTFTPADTSGSGGGISLSSLSVTQNTAGTAALSYDNTTGVFSYTPPDLSSYLTSYTVTASDLSGISIGALSDVDTASPTDGQALLWSDTNSRWEPGTVSSGGGGSSTFLGLSDTPGSFTASKYLAVNSAGDAVEFVDAPSGGGGIALTDLSITTAGTASGGGSLSYDSGTGVFTFTPADTSGGGGGSSTFLALTDTPASFGTAGQVLAVNSSADGLEFVTASSGGGGGTSLTVQTRNGSSGAEGNEATAISKITFNSASGFSVSEPNEGEAFISLGSAFAPWSVAGQTTLTPEGEEEIEFVAGDGITITTNNSSSPKSITFTASGGGGGGGGASTLGDLTDVDLANTTYPLSGGKVLKYDSDLSKWVPKSDLQGSGGGGGGGDGTAFLGENSRGSYSGGLLGLTVETQINDAIDGLNQIMTKLAPETPDNLSTKTLSFGSAMYSAYVSGTSPPELRNDIVSTTQPTTQVVANFFDGANGTLSFEVDGVVDGSIALSEGSNVGTNGGLTITADNDPYAGQNPGQNFWEQISAKGQSTTPLSAGSEHTYQLKHTTTGSTPILTFFVDEVGSVTVDSISHDSSNAVANKSFVSGVPTYDTTTPILVSATVVGAITKAYNSQKIADITGTNVTTTTVAPDSGGYNEGDSASFVNHELYFKNNTFSDSDITISLKGYDSKGTGGSSATHTIPGRIDTTSNESSRLTSGSGSAPASGYGDAYNSSQSLLDNEELQMLQNKYRYPSADYSTNYLAGPDYSGATGTRYVTFRVTGPGNKNKGTLSITSTGLQSTSEFALWQLSDNNGPISVEVKIGKGAFEQYVTSDWINANEAFSPPAIPAGVDGSGTSSNPRLIRFGDNYTNGDLYVRIGLDPGSTATITNVSMTY